MQPLVRLAARADVFREQFAVFVEGLDEVLDDSAALLYDQIAPVARAGLNVDGRALLQRRGDLVFKFLGAHAGGVARRRLEGIGDDEFFEEPGDANCARGTEEVDCYIGV